MAKIPDERALGRRPSGALRRIPNVAIAATGYQRAANVQTRAATVPAQTLQVGSQVAQAFEEADRRIQSRDDTVLRAKEASSVATQLAEEWSRVQDEEDLSDRNVAGGFVRGVNETIHNAVANHSGSEDSKAALAVHLEQYRTQYTSFAASGRRAAGDAAVNNVLESSANNLASNAYENPSRFNSLIQNWYQELGGMGEASLTPAEEIEWSRRGAGGIVQSAAESYLDNGEPEAAARLMRDPVARGLLSPQARQTLGARVIRGLQGDEPTEMWRPMNETERQAYGIPEGQGAQISNTGKGAAIGRGGGITLYRDDGSVIAQVGGDPLTQRQAGTQAIEIADEIRSSNARLSELSSALTGLRENPQAAGLSGLAIEKIGGVIEQAARLTGMDGDWIGTTEVQTVRTELAVLLGQYIPTITGDDSSRYSDQDQRRAQAALPAQNPTASFPQVDAALVTLRDIEKRARARALMRLDGFAPTIDITYPDGQLEYARQLQDEGKTFEEAGIIIADLLLKYNVPPDVVGIQ